MQQSTTSPTKAYKVYLAYSITHTHKIVVRKKCFENSLRFILTLQILGFPLTITHLLACMRVCIVMVMTVMYVVMVVVVLCVVVVVVMLVIVVCVAMVIM